MKMRLKKNSCECPLRPIIYPPSKPNDHFGGDEGWRGAADGAVVAEGLAPGWVPEGWWTDAASTAGSEGGLHVTP